MSEVRFGAGWTFVGALCFLATAVLFVLQVAGVIHAPWLLVLAPALLAFAVPIVGFLTLLAIATVVAIIGSIVTVIAHLVGKTKRAKRKKNAALLREHAQKNFPRGRK